VRAIVFIGSICGVALFCSSAHAFAGETDRKVLTIIDAESRADGRSQISKEILEECILALPTVDQLEPVTDAKSQFLKNINGDLHHNAPVRTYSAVIELTYALYQKQLVVVTTNSLERSEPVFKEVDRRFDQTVEFRSNPANGDHYHGRNLVNEYYFSTEQGAVDDAKKRAAAWLKQKQAIQCNR